MSKKDGGPLSTVWATFFPEWKKLFTVGLLRFEDGSREAYHSHAFNSISWLLKGQLIEDRIDGCKGKLTTFLPSLKPIITTRDNMHKVSSAGRSWVFTLRGPWADTWKEYTPDGPVTLTHGRKEIAYE